MGCSSFCHSLRRPALGAFLPLALCITHRTVLPLRVLMFYPVRYTSNLKLLEIFALPAVVTLARFAMICW